MEEQASQEFQSKPSGLYVIVAFLVLGCLVAISWIVTVTSYRLFGLILVPVLAYIAFGLLAGSRVARYMLMVFVVLMFGWAVLNLIVLNVTDVSGQFDDATRVRLTATNMVRVLIFPLVFFYLRSKRVRAYFDKPPNKPLKDDAASPRT